MAGISSLGIASGLDLGQLVDGLVAAERGPAKQRLDGRENRLDAEISAYGKLKSGLASLETALEKSAGLSLGNTAVSSDKQALGASADADAAPGIYSIEIGRLAKAQSLASAGFADSEAPVGAGTLSLALGDADPVTLDISADMSLVDVTNLINEADAGIGAVLVNDAGSFRLLLTGAETGAASTVNVTVSGGVDANLASAAMTQTAAPQDAQISVNGLALTNASNTLEDVIRGVTLNLNQTTEPDSPISVTVAQDDDAVAANLKGFVAAYNKVVESMNQLGRYNPESGEGGALVGDALLRSVQGQLRSGMGQIAAPGLDERVRSLLDLGISTETGGTLEFDEARLAEALGDDPAGAMAVLNTVAEDLNATVKRFSGPEGLLDSRTNSLNSSLEGVADQRERLALRMESLEQRLRSQFTALDQLVGQMQNTGDYLTQHFATSSNR